MSPPHSTGDSCRMAYLLVLGKESGNTTEVATVLTLPGHGHLEGGEMVCDVIGETGTVKVSQWLRCPPVIRLACSHS